MSTSSANPSSAVEASTAPVEDMLPRTGDIGWDGDTPHLVGSSCRDCGTRAFPRRMACAACGGTSLQDAALAVTGNLYSHTTVHISSTRATPYRLAYVDLADGVRVLSDVSPEAVAAGLDALVRLEVGAGDAGTWRFVPWREVTA